MRITGLVSGTKAQKLMEPIMTHLIASNLLRFIHRNEVLQDGILYRVQELDVTVVEHEC